MEQGGKGIQGGSVLHGDKEGYSQMDIVQDFLTIMNNAIEILKGCKHSSLRMTLRQFIRDEKEEGTRYKLYIRFTLNRL